MARSASFDVRNVISFGLLAMGIAGMGCAVDSTGDDFEVSEEAVAEAGLALTADPITNNHLPYKCLHSHKIQSTTRTLGKMPTGIANNLYSTLPSMPDMPKASATGTLAGCRRTYLEVLIGCALPNGKAVFDPADPLYTPQGPVPMVYYGEVGLAPNWKTTALSPDEKQWVTACVMARTNRFEVTIDIDLVGNNGSSLSDPVTAAYAGFSYPESRVWGDMFSSTMGLDLYQDPSNVVPAFEGHVCQLYNIVLSPDAAYRACDSQDCGFQKHGECEDFDAWCKSSKWVLRPSSCAGKKIDIFLTDMKFVDPNAYDYEPQYPYPYPYP